LLREEDVTHPSVKKGKTKPGGFFVIFNKGKGEGGGLTERYEFDDTRGGGTIKEARPLPFVKRSRGPEIVGLRIKHARKKGTGDTQLIPDGEER